MLISWLGPLLTADTGTPTGAAGSVDTSEASAETKTTETGAKTEHMIPKSRFDEVNGELQKLRTERQKQEQAAKAEADKQAAARGEFEKLATERGVRVLELESETAKTSERIAAYEAEMERQIKVRLRPLPDEIKAMAPDGDALARYAWLEKAEAAAQKLAATRTPGTPGGPRGSGAQPAVNGAGADDLKQAKRAQVGGI
jgi:hypothetical protein